MPKKNPKYSIVLPAYLEEENLRILLPRIQDVQRSLPGTSEVLVIDTVQPLDHTKGVCEELDVRYLPRAPGNTFGDAIRTGIREAQGEWILFMDADGSSTPEFIPSLVEQTPKFDVVIASRYVEGGYTENSPALIWMSRILNFSYSLILNLKCKDVSINFKIYRAELLKELKLSCQNFDIIEEILFKISRKNKKLKIKEVPFSFKKRMFGETKRNLVVFIATYIFTMIKLRFSLK